MSDVVLKRWVRYGHDRLYVQTADGHRLGYWDNKASTAQLQDDSHRDLFFAALAAAGLTQAGPEPALEAPVPPPQRRAAELEAVDHAGREAHLAPEPCQPAAITAAPTAGPQWKDLADNRAGAAVRAQAQQARADAPIKTTLARLFGVHTQERAWRLGADGEEAVAKWLSKLDDRWRVLHSVPVGSRDSDIDHVVIGPGGVYTVNAKNHPDARIWVGGDTFTVNGRRVPYIRNSRHEAQRASRLLAEAVGFPVFVTGLLAVYGAAGGFTLKNQPAADIVVLTRRETAKWLSRRPETLTAEQVEAIYDHARRSTTWSTRASASA
jgi:hypothetical protein